ncbi:MAG: HAD hydrolase-like protein [Rhodospirillales bacterium]|nr:HAD hydrolase-like protein [Rhodospirillales bacterium]
MTTAERPFARDERAGEKLVRPLAILFDWDNTLIDSWAAIEDAQNYTLAYFGLKPWTSEQVRERVRGSMRDTFPEMFGQRWREAGEVFYARFTEHHLETLRPVSGAEEMLATLQKDGVYLAVVSNKKGDYLRAEAARLGWGHYFAALVGAFDAAKDKPATDPVELALAGSGIASGPRVWFAGDTDIDLECACNAGCVPVLVRATAPGPDEFSHHPPAVYVADCISLLKVVRNL